MSENLRPARIVIIGAGLAGMATAYQLAVRGETDVLVLEKENVPRLHSSGRNASMIRQVVPEKDILPLARGGADFLRDTASSWDDPPPFAVHGSILTATGERWERLIQEGQWTNESGAATEIWSREQVERAVPVTRGGDFEGGIWCPSDGVTDAQQLLGGFYREARRLGVRLASECEVEAIASRRGRIEAVRTAQGLIPAEVVVNASGPWAGLVGTLARALPIQFRPMRRHLFFSGELGWAAPDWPYVWDVSREVYFRPESSGLLLSPCDESSAEPGLPSPDPSAQDLLADKLGKAFPRLLDTPVARSWAGLRTFAPDRHFVIGWDPRLDGFYWVAGLGGHGVTTSAAVGALAAGEILSPGGELHRSPFSPSRFT